MDLQAARRELASYAPEDERERGFRDRIIALLDTVAPLSRTQFAPGHLTASAFVLSPAEDALLLIFHKKLQLWLQPGGHVEASDESMAAAARREVKEEVGIDLGSQASAVFDVDIHDIPRRKDELPHQHFDVRFCFRASGLEYIESDEVEGARWVELSKIDQLTADESVLRAVRKLRRR